MESEAEGALCTIGALWPGGVNAASNAEAESEMLHFVQQNTSMRREGFCSKSRGE
jgi:hypothetical protein